MATLTPDTQQELTDGQEVANLLESKGWAFIHAKLSEKVADLQNIANLDLTNPDSINTQIAARIMAAKFIHEWLQNDVFGYAEQQKANGTAMVEKQDEGFIGRE